MARVSKQTDLKPTTKGAHATFEEPQEQEQSKKVGNHKHRTINKPKESPVQFMTDEMVDQLLARNHQIAAIQTTTDSKEIENEIRRHGEELTNDLLAFTTNK